MAKKKLRKWPHQWLCSKQSAGGSLCFDVSHGHLATESGRHYAPLSFVVICCNDIMTAVRPNDGRSPNDGGAK